VVGFGVHDFGRGLSIFVLRGLRHYCGLLFEELGDGENATGGRRIYQSMEGARSLAVEWTCPGKLTIFFP